MFCFLSPFSQDVFGNTYEPRNPQHSVSLRTPKVARQTWGGVSSGLARHRASDDAIWSYITGTGRCQHRAQEELRKSTSAGVGDTPGSPGCPREKAMALRTPALPPAGFSAFPALMSICVCCVRRQSSGVCVVGWGCKTHPVFIESLPLTG